MSIWYRAQFGSIEEIEVLKETSAFVYPNDGQGRRVAKRSDWSNWFPTKEEAVQHLLDLASWKMDKARKQLDAAEKEYGEIKRKYPLAQT